MRALRPRNLLVVDWDYFVPWRDRAPDGTPTREFWLFDWGAQESKLFIEVLWPMRASGFLRYDLPLPDTSGEETTFWQRFRISEDAPLFFGDSNALAVHIAVTTDRPRFESVWLFDAHHDSGYKNVTTLSGVNALVHRGRWDCSNWMIFYAAIRTHPQPHVRYPTWKAYALTHEHEPIIPVDRRVDDGAAVDVTFDRVFVCRSGAWTPPWTDAKFFDFVSRCPTRGPRLNLDAVSPRVFDVEAALRLSEGEKVALNGNDG